MKRTASLLVLVTVLPAFLWAAPRDKEQRPDPSQVPGLPSHAQKVQTAVVGIKVQVPRDRPSVFTLGPERWGSGVIFDAAGYALTVSYVLLDADRIEVSLRDGRKLPARLVGLDLEVGVGVVKIEGAGPFPVAALGDSSGVSAGQITATVGMSDDGDLVVTPGSVQAIRSFAGYWEYLLDRAFVVAPYNPAFGGSALVNERGEVIGVVSLRLGQHPSFVNLAIPIEKFVRDRDELMRDGRVTSRKPRPWVGLYTVSAEDGAVVVGVSPAGPAASAGFERGDRIVRMNGEPVKSQEEFYARLWQAQVGQEITIVVVREGRFHAVTVKPADRYRVFRTTDK